MSVEAFKSLVTQTSTALTSSGASRKTALDAFDAFGIPTVRHEEWKYTNVLPLFAKEYSHNASPGVSTNALDKVALSLAQSLPENTISIAIVNGIVQSFNTPKVNGLTISTLNDSQESSSTVDAALKLLASKTPVESHPFVAVNAAVSPDALLIHAAANADIAETIHVSMITDARENNAHASPRIVVVCDKGAQVTIVESHHTIGANTALSTSNSQFVVAENATAQYIKINDDIETSNHIGFAGAYVQRAGTMKSASYCLGGAFTRNDLQIELLGEGAEAYLDGVSVLKGSQYADNHTVVDHAVPHCHSEELYKGVYDGKSVGVFNGKVFVRPNAQKTTAYQSNHTLLMSDKATVNAKPQLEIWADDVKCSHGATTGQLDEDAIFYLRARGIGEQKARNMMTYAFAAEVVERQPLNGLRLFIEQRIASSLRTEAIDR